MYAYRTDNQAFSELITSTGLVIRKTEQPGGTWVYYVTERDIDIVQWEADFTGDSREVTDAELGDWLAAAGEEVPAHQQSVPGDFSYLADGFETDWVDADIDLNDDDEVREAAESLVYGHADAARDQAVYADEEHRYFPPLPADYDAAVAYMILVIRDEVASARGESWRFDEATVSLTDTAPQQSPSPYGGYTTGTTAHVWQQRRGWYSCISGIGPDGNAFESDDAGPFWTREAALAAARELAATPAAEF